MFALAAGVPAHDERDYGVATRLQWDYIDVIQPTDGEDAPPYTGQAGTLINSGDFNGCTVEQAVPKIISLLQQLDVGESTTVYRLRDWLVSRQRYWGCPIPVIHCPECGVVPVPEEQLPVKLPKVSLERLWTRGQSVSYHACRRQTFRTEGPAALL